MSLPVDDLNLPESGEVLARTRMATIFDVPHLSARVRRNKMATWPEYEVEARSRGIPVLGSGNVYQKPESQFFVPDFAIPDHWKIIYGMDPGVYNTAAIFLTKAPQFSREEAEEDQLPSWVVPGLYLIIGEYKEGKREPFQHAEAIMAIRGDRRRGLIDPSANTPSMVDGRVLLHSYRKLGMRLTMSKRSVEGGIALVRNLINADQLKAFRSCVKFKDEYRTYRRDLKGNPIKKNDHLCDGLRYSVTSGLHYLDPGETVDEERKTKYSELRMRRQMAYDQGHWNF